MYPVSDVEVSVVWTKTVARTTVVGDGDASTTQQSTSVGTK